MCVPTESSYQGTQTHAAPTHIERILGESTMTLDRWDNFARDDAFYYIWTDFKGDEKEFWESGRKVAEDILSTVRELCGGFDTVVEIGCGVGRVLIPMTSYFQCCVGVDISSNMLERLHGYSDKMHVGDKIRTFSPDQEWDTLQADLVYSLLVFQHIEDFQMIRQYIARISRVITDNGAVYLQFDTRPQSILYRLRNMIPDCLLAKSWRKGIRRIRRTRKDLLGLFKECELDILAENGAGTDYHVFILSKSR